MIDTDSLVLIGEDEPDNRLILQTVVETLLGVRAQVAGDGLAVLAGEKKAAFGIFGHGDPGAVGFWISFEDDFDFEAGESLELIGGSFGGRRGESEWGGAGEQGALADQLAPGDFGLVSRWGLLAGSIARW